MLKATLCICTADGTKWYGPYGDWSMLVCVTWYVRQASSQNTHDHVHNTCSVLSVVGKKFTTTQSQQVAIIVHNA